MTSKCDANNNSCPTEKCPPQSTTTILNLEPSSAVLEERARHRRSYIRQHGIRVFGTSPQCSPKSVPVWFDRKAFNHAQKLYQTYGAIIGLSQFYGLMLVLNFYEGLAPLLVTGKSATISALFTRYLSTSVHLNAWFTADPFDPESKAYRSLKIVRGLHQQVGRRLNALTGGLGSLPGKEFIDGDLWMSQWGMMHAQFTFMGFSTVFPELLGFGTFSAYDRHCLFHFWRTIGYCLGIEDRFNLCSPEDDDEVVEFCRQTYYEEWRPKILLGETPGEGGEATGVAMAEGIARAMFRVLPAATYRAMLRYAAPSFGLNRDAYPLRGFHDHVSFGIIWWTMNVIARSTVLLWTGCRFYFAFQRLAFWCRSAHQWTLKRRYTAERYQYRTDSRCPFEVTGVNYRTAWEHRVR